VAPAADKSALVVELIERIAAALEAARAAHRAATEGATHEQARPENSKDTRGLEQSYVARGQAARVAELEASLALVQTFAPRAFRDTDAVALGAPDSPLGRALLGRRAGDVAELQLRGPVRELEIVALA
jgi:hypothetical protein